MLGKITKWVMAMVAFGVALLWFSNYSSIRRSSEIGVQAVKLLYQFYDLEELDSNMTELKKITSGAVYDELTIDNEERLLNTYLKLKGNTCLIHVIECTSDYVTYSLETETIDKDRKFIFMFEVRGGKIIKVKEAECIDFTNS